MLSEYMWFLLSLSLKKKTNKTKQPKTQQPKDGFWAFGEIVTYIFSGIVICKSMRVLNEKPAYVQINMYCY